MTNVADFFASDAGPIPVGWDVSTVGAEFDVRLGKMLDAARNVGEPKPYLGNRSVQWGQIDVNDLGMVPLTRAEQLALRLRSGDLLVCEGGEVGRAAIWRDQLPECYYQKALHRLRPRNGYSPELMAAYLRLWSDRGALADYVTQTSIAHLPREKLVTVPLPRPPATEQRAITAALSDVDDLLATLDQLIAKKRYLKQAAMQQLLTGRTRLEGFTAPWQQIQLGRLGSFGKGRGLAKDDLARGGELPAVPYTAIYTDFGQIASMMDVAGRVLRSRAEVTVNKPCLLIASSSNMLENIGKAVALCIDDEVAVGGDVLIFRTQADVRFLSYLLSTEAHRRRVVALSQGSTIRHVYAATFSAYEVELPSRDEQVAIADALADIDAELAALEARREKTRQLKQGMMQALLTGRIRLV